MLVTLLVRSEGLLTLHRDIITTLEKGGLALNDPHFAYDGFLPHATVQRSTRLNKGDEVEFTRLSVVDMFPGSNPYKRRVLKAFTVGADD